MLLLVYSVLMNLNVEEVFQKENEAFPEASSFRLKQAAVASGGGGCFVLLQYICILTAEYNKRYKEKHNYDLRLHSG